MRRLGIALFTAIVIALMWPLAALAHDQPETKQSRWVMADWMIDTFFIFGGLCSYFYYLVCRDRAEKAKLAADQSPHGPSDVPVAGLEH